MAVPRISIMLLEDDPALRKVLGVILDDAGYAVAPVENGDNAVRMLEDPASRYRVLITEIKLDRGKLSLTGWDVAHRARELNPDIAVVYISAGSGRGDWASRGTPKSVLVTKPFGCSQITAAVSQLLSETR